jgi:outer membrane lipoprotein LolB
MRGFVAAAAAAALCGCASLAPVAPMALPPGRDTAFAIDGRLSARGPGAATTVTFSWSHDPPRDTLTLASALGQVLAELVGDSDTHRMVVTHADGQQESAADWKTLTESALGISLPVSALALWVRGLPHGDSTYVAEADAAGRVAVLRQDGWSIDYGYADAISSRPVRLRVVGATIELRIVIDRWN